MADEPIIGRYLLRGGVMEHWPKRKMDANGRKVRTRVELETSQIKVPAGTVLTVTQYYSDWVMLEGERCPHCGITPRMGKVPISYVELLPREA